MITAIEPEFDNERAYSNLAVSRAEESHNELANLWPTINGLYDAYTSRLKREKAPQPEIFTNFQSDALKSNYQSYRFKTFRTAVLASAGGKCAYCNNSDATELDHYLPKNIFAEYAIYSTNLTPICNGCNKSKGERYESGEGGRKFLHPYVDKLPLEISFLTCKVTVGETVYLDFCIDRQWLPDQIANILESHFETLDLGTKYRAKGLEDMQERLDAFYAHHRKSVNQLREYLAIEGKSVARRRGKNHWLPVMLGALSNSEDFYSGGFRTLGLDPLS